MMDLLGFVVSIFLLTSSIIAEETFENSTQLCERCKCVAGSEFILDCQKQGFRHMIANWPQHNTSLIATFSYNNITNIEVLPDSDYVTEVVLSHCGIQSLDNGAFESVKYLKYLDLSFNLLKTEEIAPEKFKGPYNNSTYEPLSLEHLDLSYNEIHSLPHNIFEHLITLKELNLEGNDFRVLDHPTQVALSGLKNLQNLNLANNELTELVGDSVRNLPSLKILNLATNKLDFVPETLSLLGNSLEVLYLDNNLIFEITDNSFLGLQGIKILSLTNLPRLQYVNANAFAPLKSLEILYLSNNPVLTTIDREAFGEDQVLKELYIHNNSLQDLHYNLTSWSKLQLFTLIGNDLICDCDLYKISEDLAEEIKRDKDGPYCINPMNDESLMIYNLTEEACDFEQYNIRTSHVIERHFRTMKLVFMIVWAVFAMTTFMALTIGYLKYRRYKMNQNYPFTTQVTYNPLRNPNM